MVDLEYNGERYMVDGWKWYRRLKVGERIMDDAEVSTITMPLWRETHISPTKVLNNPSMSYRVPCTDPRPPFVVGQRVKVARKDESWPYWESCMEAFIGMETPAIAIDHDGDVAIDVEHEGEWYFPPWCLDPAEQKVTPEIIDEVKEISEQNRLDHLRQEIASGASVVDRWPAWKQGLFVAMSQSENTYLRDPVKLDPVDPVHEDTLAELEIDRIEREFPGHMDSLCGDEPDTDPELDHILRKLKPHTHIAADVRRIKRECYQKLAALLPEEKR